MQVLLILCQVNWVRNIPLAGHSAICTGQESHLLRTISFSMWSQNSGVSQSGTSGKMRAVVLFVSMITCLHSVYTEVRQSQ